MEIEDTVQEKEVEDEESEHWIETALGDNEVSVSMKQKMQRLVESIKSLSDLNGKDLKEEMEEFFEGQLSDWMDRFEKISSYLNSKDDFKEFSDDGEEDSNE